MVDGMCSCCGYLASCMEFVGMRTLLICAECSQRAAANAGLESVWVARPRIDAVPARKPPAREVAKPAGKKRRIR